MNIFDKTLYLQRLIYAQGQALKGISNNDDRRQVITALNKQAETEIDNAIMSMTDSLEVMGILPVIREV